MTIGIVGAGIAGLQLGLLLQQHDVPVIIYTDRTGEQVFNGRLMNTVSHFGPTLDRETELGVNFWPQEEWGYTSVYVDAPGDPLFAVRGDFDRWVRAIDHRTYLPRLMDTFEERGGDLRIGRLEPDDIPRLAATHDLLVVSAGRGAFADLFGRRAEKSPYSTPQRVACVPLVHGVVPNDPPGVHIAYAEMSELIDIPLVTRYGRLNGLYFSSRPDGPLAFMAEVSYDEDPGGFEKMLLEVMREHYPTVYERIDHKEFAVTGPLDVLQGAITPTVRNDYAVVDGRCVLAVGDVHTVVDPVMGQGANSASNSAWIAGQAILSEHAPDELLCERVARRRADLVMGASDFTNFMLDPQPHLADVFAGMAASQAASDEIVQNFARPDQQWAILASPQRTTAFLARHGIQR